MATEAQSENYLELVDVAKKEQVGKVPLPNIRFIPRTGERIFFPSSSTPGHWVSYTVVAVEYFIGYDLITGQPGTSATGGAGRITLYVEESK
ncbi:MAG TPA: hypothetical protein VGY99_00620 [Candidatus Binataceae bacterium]|nr:hypothetical protein [Candidatus Binataceae bacterium]